jgi:aminopeptidase
MKQELIEKYAELIVKVGANVQKGQYVVIRTGVFEEEFASIVAKQCYLQGAKRVFVHWESPKLNLVDNQYADEEVLKEVPFFEEACHKFMLDELPVLIWLDGDDPDGQAGMDNAKASRIRQAKYKILGKYREQRENHFQWVIAGVPSEKWAKKVFPDLDKDEAIEALWEKILYTSRALDGNGIENWIRHDENLKKKCEYLNSLGLRELRYHSSNGTDFKVGLIPNVVFAGGDEKTLSGIHFQPNIPTEECFTSPMKGVAEGIVYATKPLSYQGQLIEDFSIRFHEGKAVEVHARKGEEALKSILTLDEGSAYLGECALVPYHSPINLTNILFFNTLYDENAACHLALGTGFNNLYPDFEKYTDKEIQSFGINYSLSHVDFMIGSEDMDIIGIDESGKEIQIFRNGDWAF